MRALVLAAGTGSRLGEITRVRTKGMVPVCGKRLIDYILNFLGIPLFHEIIVVGGFCWEDLKNHVDGLKIPNARVVENREYFKGNILSLVRGLEEFSGDSFLITNVDHIYPAKMFETMKNSFSGITAMCDFDRKLGQDDMKVKLAKDSDKILKIDKKLTDFNCGYIGMTYVDKTMEHVYKKAVAKTLERYGDKAVVENVLQVLAEDGTNAPSIFDLSGTGWFELDTPEDLKKAEEGIMKDRAKFGI